MRRRIVAEAGRAVSRYHAKRRARRVAARICIDCEAGLQEEDYVLCVECFEARKKSSAKYRATAKAKATRAKWEQAHMTARRAGDATWHKRSRLRKKLKGECTHCQPATGDTNMCDVHRALHTQADVRYRARKKAKAA